MFGTYSVELGPDDLGFMVGNDMSIGLARKSPKKRERPRGSKNKKLVPPSNSDSMASSSGVVGMPENSGGEEPAAEKLIVASEAREETRGE